MTFCISFETGCYPDFQEKSTCSLFLTHDRRNSRIIFGRRGFPKETMGRLKSGCATTWTFVQNISFRPQRKRACLSFLPSCGKRGNRRLNKSKLLALSGCSTSLLRKKLPPESRPWAREAARPERPTMKR